MVSDHHSPSTFSPLTLFLPCLLLAFAHLPFVVVQCQRLWALEYYQFFPFAFLAFGWLLHSRRQRGTFRWDWLNTLFVTLDICLLVAGAIINSPLAVYSGALLLCLAICRSSLDAEYERSLGYLFLMLLITLRPPLMYDEKIINWLQTVTTKVGSRLLNQFGYLHIREGNILTFPGKRFLVEEACSGVQSLFTVLFLATLIVCGYRRRMLHSVFVIGAAFGFAGLMNILRICTISIAWSQSRIDLSSGWQHDSLGYIALAAAAFLVFSTDAFMEFCLAPVPDSRGSGISLLFRNPFIFVWNRMFRNRTRSSEAAPATVSMSTIGGRLLLGFALVICVSTLTLQWLVM